MTTSRHAATDTATTRVCSACDTPKLFVEFPTSKTGYAGYSSRCRECTRAASRASRLSNMYGLSEADYQRMFEAQGGRCYVCGNRPRKTRLAVDHDHETGLIRGLLCPVSRCNDVLGIYRDNVEVFRRFVAYLEAPPAPDALGREHRVTPEQEQRHRKARRSRVTRR
jgi:hypothetical protein